MYKLQINIINIKISGHVSVIMMQFDHNECGVHACHMIHLRDRTIKTMINFEQFLFACNKTKLITLYSNLPSKTVVINNMMNQSKSEYM